jgi:hypothetical protein
MSDLDIVNFMMIDDVNRSTKNHQLLTDLQSKAAYLAKKTGAEPMSWYEFQQMSPKEPPHTFRNITVGAAIGAAIGAGIGLFALPLLPAIALTGALLGGVGGAFAETENVRRSKQVKGYEKYLNEFELGHARGVFPQQQQPTPAPQEGKNVERLRAQEAKAAEQSCATCPTR